MGNIEKLIDGAPFASPDGKYEYERYFIKAGVKKAVDFIESYLVTTVCPEGNMHHIDDKEWQSVKLRLLR